MHDSILISDNRINHLSVPKLFSHFQLLSQGSAIPEGWLKEYALAIADGWSLMHARDRIPEVYSTYWNRIVPPNGYWDGAPDYAAYFGDGMIRLANILPESKLAEEVDEWLYQVLASQEEDGYLGAVDPPARWHQWIDVFSQSLMIEALLCKYETTRDKHILAVCEKSASRIIEAFGQPEEEVTGTIFSGHGVITVRAMRALYKATGNCDFRDFAVEIMRRYGKQEEYLRWCMCETADPNTTHDPVSKNHSVTEAENIGFPAITYEISGDERMLQASIIAWEIAQKYQMVDGQLNGNEIICKCRPRSIGEHCTSVEWAITNEELSRLTGDVRYADAVETCVFNAYPGSKSPDTLTLAYMHSVNEIVASEWSHPHYDDHDGEVSKGYFSTAHNPLCCNVISPRQIPYYVENMVYRHGDGLAVALYGPARIATEIAGAGLVKLVMDTQYPFEDDVRFVIDVDGDVEFPIEFRIPNWCSSASFELNGNPMEVDANPGTYAVVRRKWQSGDVLRLHFEMPIRLKTFPATIVRVEGVAVTRGPLVFVMPVAEDWREYEIGMVGPGKPPKPWMVGPGKAPKSFKVIPRENAAWNYALIIDRDDPESSFKMKTLPSDGLSIPWQKPTIGMEVNARRVLNWGAEGSKEHPMTPGLPIAPMRLSEEIESVTLVPYGCSRLRMSYLPVICALEDCCLCPRDDR